MLQPTPLFRQVLTEKITCRIITFLGVLGAARNGGAAARSPSLRFSRCKAAASRSTLNFTISVISLLSQASWVAVAVLGDRVDSLCVVVAFFYESSNLVLRIIGASSASEVNGQQ